MAAGVFPAAIWLYITVLLFCMRHTQVCAAAQQEQREQRVALLLSPVWGIVGTALPSETFPHFKQYFKHF